MTGSHNLQTEGLVIHNLGCVYGLGLGSIHISGNIWDYFVVDGRLGGRGELGAIALIVILLTHD